MYSQIKNGKNWTHDKKKRSSAVCVSPYDFGPVSNNDPTLPPNPIYLLRLKTGQSFAVIFFLQSTREAKLFYKKQKPFDSKIHERHDYI